jgi:UDP-2-acetamido-3-amino-2,3-dideoxy-glucuronate N-acetyltransferase
MPKKPLDKYWKHPTAIVEETAEIGLGTKVWVQSQVRESAQIGKCCILSKDTFIDQGVIIGDYCKIQNGVSIYAGVTLENHVFVGPNACFSNDKVPRSFSKNWQISQTLVKVGASIGSNATLVCGITIGAFSMVAAGAVVTKSVAPFSLVMGNPAKHVAWIDKWGNRQKSQPSLIDLAIPKD